MTKQGKPFTSEMVRAMLQNRTYIGEVRYQPYHTHMDGSRDKSPRIEWFKGQHEPLVPIALFDRCQEIRRLLRRRPKRQGCFQVYLLGGLIYCDYCGRRMRSQRSPCGKRYYRCGNRIVDKPCEHRMIPASVAEAQVAAMISRIANTENWRAHIAGTGTTGTQIDQRARELKQAVERLDLQWDQGFIAKDQYLARRIELQKQLEQLQPFSEPELKEAEELLEKFEKSWSVDDTIEHKRLFNRVAEKVWIRGRRVTALRLRPLFAYLAQHVSGIDVDGKGVIVAKDG